MVIIFNCIFLLNWEKKGGKVHIDRDLKINIFKDFSLIQKYNKNLKRLNLSDLRSDRKVIYKSNSFSYQDTCSEVVPPMLKIFQKHYKIFCGPEKTALDFVYCILTVVASLIVSCCKPYTFNKLPF